MEIDKKIIEENKRLVEKYPFLIPYEDENFDVLDKEKYDYSWTFLDDMPQGWKKCFGELLCQDLKEELVRNDFLDKYQVVQVKEKYGCYDTQTEVLTKNGWKFFKDVDYDDEFLTFDDNNNLVYQKPTDIIAYHYKGQMYHLQNRGIDLLVTPNHNLYVAKGSYYNGRKNCEKRLYNFELATPDKYFGKDKRFSKGGKNWEGKKINDVYTIPGRIYTNSCTLIKKRTYKLNDLNFDTMAFMRFLGFYVAEGCTTFKKKNGVNWGTEIQIAYNPNDEEELVTKLIKDIGFEPKQTNNRTKRFYNSTLAHWLRENCGHKAWNKKVPPFIKELEPKYIEEFLKYLYIGDGHKTETYNILTTTSKQLSEEVEELLIKCGYAFRTTSRNPHKTRNKKWNIQSKHIVYEINWLKNTDIEIDMSKIKNNKKFLEQWEKYDDFVYCVTIPTHVLYIKRNGKGLWCGNSLRWYDNGVPENSKVPEIIYKYERISEYTCINCGAFPDVRMTRGWICPICKDCYDKNKYFAKGFEENTSENPFEPIITLRRYSKDEGETIIKYDITDIANRIKERNKK